jgi:hypothetical protein
LRRRTKFSASDVDFGYSQSMSIPSKPKSLMRETDEEAKSALPLEVDAGAAKLEE